MWLRDNQPRCWALWFFCSNQAACLNHHRAGAEPARSWGNHFYAKYLAKMWATDRDKGHRGREELWKMTVENEETVFWNKSSVSQEGVTLQQDWRQSGEGRKTAHLHSAHFVLICSFAFIFLLLLFRLAAKFCKRLPLPKPTKKTGYWDGASYLWMVFFLFCFSEMDC